MCVSPLAGFAVGGQIQQLPDMIEVRSSKVHMNITQSLFQVEIYSDQDYFHIFINENKVLQYKHRQKNLSSITKLQILNDIDIFSVEITQRGLY